MNEELFPIDTISMDSPRLSWIKKHGIITFRHPGFLGGFPPSWFAGFQSWWPELHDADFFAQETAYNGDFRCVEADTEEEALQALAVRYKISLWNE